MKFVYKKGVSRPFRVVPHHYSYATGEAQKEMVAAVVARPSLVR